MKMDMVGGGTTKPIALVVDDDFLIRMDVASILEDAGFDTLEAGDGDKAITLLTNANETVQVVFTDVQMPGSRDGFALAREVARRWPDIGIVVASGTRRPGPDEMPEGATFIAKPFGAETIHEHLCKVLPNERRPAPLRDRA
ncbi:response regulator [Methylorubrum rhodesianum]|jgi:DNA-binding NtrC family response regulator|uniref:response regulator n=1 Tax=Methylorubrum TaxID=2282523 RepID=UPI0018360F39|nr:MULTISPECIES: response regulator [Methylorubrum]MBB5760642.1 DNA-binding NtrC family response regulator [Methylorubrum rhodesianum]